MNKLQELNKLLKFEERLLELLKENKEVRFDNNNIERIFEIKKCPNRSWCESSECLRKTIITNKNQVEKEEAHGYCLDNIYRIKVKK